MPKSVDLDEFEAAAPAHRCVCWFTRLTTEQKDKVLAARESGYSPLTIARVVSGWGVPVTKSPVANHFREGHTCD